jgi:hypothetical protein
MADLATIEAALRKADALAQTGDQQAMADAKVLANAYRTMRDAAPEAPKHDYRGEGLAGTRVGAAITGAAQAVSLGTADEAKAWLQSKFAGKDYDEALTQERNVLSQMREENPVAAYGGEIAGSLLLPGAAMKAGASVASNALRMGAAGAGLGGAYGFGAGEGGLGPRMQSAAVGGAVGGAVGAAAPYAVKAATRALDKRAVRKAISAAADNAPAPEASKAASKALFESLDKRGVVFGDDASQRLMSKMDEALAGFDEDTAPITLRKVSRLAQKAAPTATPQTSAAPAAVGTQAPKRPQTVLEALQEVGVRERGGDLTAMGVRDWDKAQKFQRNALRADGMDEDKAAKMLWDRGYFRDMDIAQEMLAAEQGLSPEPDLVRAMHRAIDDEMAGEPWFSQGDYDAASDWRAYFDDPEGYARAASAPVDEAPPIFGEGAKSPPAPALSFSGLMNTREALSKQALNKMTSDGAAAAKALGAIDGFVSDVMELDAVSGNVAGLSDDWKEARSLWKRFRNSERLQEIVSNAEMKDNPALAVKNGFRGILSNPKKRATYSEAERAVMRQVVDDTKAGSLIQRLVGYGTGLSRQVAATTAGYGVGGPLGAAVGSAVATKIGSMAKDAASDTALAAADRAARFSATGGQYALPAPAQAPRLQNALRHMPLPFATGANYLNQ